MTARRFTADYREEAQLRDGKPVIFRLIRPEDKQQLLDGLARMSPESRFRRFFSHRDRLSPVELAYLTELDQETHFAIAAGCPIDGGAESGASEVGLGVARFVVLPDPEGRRSAAEAAIAVVDEAQGQGLGRMLFERLVLAAAERGVELFRFDVLAENDTMLKLVKSLFPAASSHVEDGIMTIDCPLPDLSENAAGQRPDGAMYRILKLAAAGAVRILRAAGDRDAGSAVLKSGHEHAAPAERDLADLIGLKRSDGPAPADD